MSVARWFLDLILSATSGATVPGYENPGPQSHTVDHNDS
jgi:hypothetical protein